MRSLPSQPWHLHFPGRRVHGLKVSGSQICLCTRIQDFPEIVGIFLLALVFQLLAEKVWGYVAATACLVLFGGLVFTVFGLVLRQGTVPANFSRH